MDNLIKKYKGLPNIDNIIYFIENARKISEGKYEIADEEIDCKIIINKDNNLEIKGLITNGKIVYTKDKEGLKYEEFDNNNQLRRIVEVFHNDTIKKRKEILILDNDSVIVRENKYSDNDIISSVSIKRYSDIILNKCNEMTSFELEMFNKSQEYMVKYRMENGKIILISGNLLKEADQTCNLESISYDERKMNVETKMFINDSKEYYKIASGLRSPFNKRIDDYKSYKIVFDFFSKDYCNNKMDVDKSLEVFLKNNNMFFIISKKLGNDILSGEIKCDVPEGIELDEVCNFEKLDIIKENLIDKIYPLRYMYYNECEIKSMIQDINCMQKSLDIHNKVKELENVLFYKDQNEKGIKMNLFTFLNPEKDIDLEKIESLIYNQIKFNDIKIDQLEISQDNNMDL